jgi:hypothetical protein
MGTALAEGRIGNQPMMRIPRTKSDLPRTRRPFPLDHARQLLLRGPTITVILLILADGHLHQSHRISTEQQRVRKAVLTWAFIVFDGADLAGLLNMGLQAMELVCPRAESWVVGSLLAGEALA